MKILTRTSLTSRTKIIWYLLSLSGSALNVDSSFALGAAYIRIVLFFQKLMSKTKIYVNNTATQSMTIVLFLTLPTLGFFENGSLGVGSKWPPPLKIFNNDVKMLKLVPNLGNHTKFPKSHQKKFCDQNFWWRQHFLAKSGKFRSNFQKFVIF